jgi:hypothetical protein
MVENGPGVLDDNICAALKRAACELSLSRRDTMLVSTVVCNGVIKTAWTTQSVGTRSGVLFRAQLESDKGPFKVNFLLSEDDLKRGAELIKEIEEGRTGTYWGKSPGMLPVEALYDFYDLTEPRGRLN